MIEKTKLHDVCYCYDPKDEQSLSFYVIFQKTDIFVFPLIPGLL